MKQPIIILLLMLVTVPVLAQEENQENTSEEPTLQDSPLMQFVQERVLFGGSAGLSFGDVTYVNIAPTVGVRLTERLTTGLGAEYMYLNYRDFDYKYSIFGGRIFGQFYPLDFLITHAEFEVLNTPSFQAAPTVDSRVWVPALPVGGGIKQNFSGRGFFQLLLLYDLINDPNSPYRTATGEPNPIRIRASVMF